MSECQLRGSFGWRRDWAPGGLPGTEEQASGALGEGDEGETGGLRLRQNIIHLSTENYPAPGHYPLRGGHSLEYFLLKYIFVFS